MKIDFPPLDPKPTDYSIRLMSADGTRSTSIWHYEGETRWFWSIDREPRGSSPMDWIKAGLAMGSACDRESAERMAREFGG